MALVDTKNLSTTEQSLFLWDLGSGEQKVLSTSLADRYSVSPKGKLLAFDVAIFEDNLLKSRTIEIIDSHGNLLTTIDQQEEWYGFEWLGEENLLINFPIENNPLILLSPFMHEQNIIEPFSAEGASGARFSRSEPFLAQPAVGIVLKAQEEMSRSSSDVLCVPQVLPSST